MQKVAQSWLVLEMSKSPFLLGLDSFLGDIPILLFSLIGGVVADRVDRRRMLIFSQVIQLSSAFLLAFLYSIGVVKVWHILSLSFVSGTAQAFGGPAYQALYPVLVDPEDLPNAIALQSIQFNMARVIGPALGGVAFTYLGYAWCFSLNGLSFIAVIISLALLRIKFIPEKSGVSVLTSMKQGFGFIRNQGAMVALIMLTCLGALIAAFALSTSVALSCVLLFLAGIALIAVFTLIQSLVQLITGNEMRGRVMSVYNVAFRGGMPIGSLLTGWLVPRYTAPVVLAVNGTLLFLLGLYFLMAQRRVAEL